MRGIVMAYIFIVLMLGCIWYAGFSCAVKVIKALEKRKPTSTEYLLAAIPGINVGLIRKAMHGSGAVVYVSTIVLWVAVLVRIVLYLNPGLLLMSLVSLIVTWVAIVVAWSFQAHALWTTVTLLDMGLMLKLLSVVFPPISMYYIGRDCAYHVSLIEDEIARKVVEEN